MKQRQIVSGFSEIKDLLVQKYKINKGRENIRLHFTMSDGELIVHDYHRHSYQIILTSVGFHSISNTLPNSFARELVDLALKELDPAIFLNQQFNLHGFFRF